MLNQTTREHLEFHLRRLKGARAAAAEMSLKPRSGGLELLTATHLAVLALEATLSEGMEPEPSALQEVIADLGQASGPGPAGEAGPSGRDTPGDALATWWRASFAPFTAFAAPPRDRG